MLEDEIKRLIELKQEGDYWDFKRQWYFVKTGKNENTVADDNVDMIHDIICMANNTKNRDSYIIIGVDENNDYKFLDVTRNQQSRRNTQQLVDLIGHVPFASERPVVMVQELKFDDNTIDIIIIKNGTATPYYLTHDYGKGKIKVLRDHIYTRVQDTNTSKIESADYNIVRNLWMKNFGLLLSPIEKVQRYLKKEKDWQVRGDKNSPSYYYKVDPAYTINQTKLKTKTGDFEYYLFTKAHPDPYWSRLDISYHQTVLFECLAVMESNKRQYVPAPEKGNILVRKESIRITYAFLIKDSLTYILYNFFYNNMQVNPITKEKYPQPFMDNIILFESEEQKKEFEIFVRQNWNPDKYEKCIDQYKYVFDYAEDAPKINVKLYREQAINIQILQVMFKEFNESKV